MILNSFTILMLFISFITGLLSFILLFSSLSLYRKTLTVFNVEGRVLVEERSHLLLVIAITVFIIKLLIWPFLYVTLQSYIPYVQGAMCIFGVTQVQSGFSVLIQIIKPFVFFSLGAWLIVNKIDERTERALLQRKGFLLLSGASLLSLLDSLIDILYFSGFDIKTSVACCTTVFDLPEKRFTATLSSVFIGKEYQGFIMPLYYLSNLFFLSLMISILVYYRYKGSYPLVLVTGAGLMGLINGAVTLIATFEVIAPRVTGLPDHHCLYCLWQYAPVSIPFTAFFIIGTLSPLWAVVIQFFRHDKLHSVIINDYMKRLYLLGIGLNVSITFTVAIEHVV
ncbi:MAG: hypothetical protein ACK415_01230 [Thermodesulfovibrionales bacterium]